MAKIALNIVHREKVVFLLNPPPKYATFRTCTSTISVRPIRVTGEWRPSHSEASIDLYSLIVQNELLWVLRNWK